MAKVAAKKDVRGKVVLRMRGGAASPLILEAAVRVARSFRGDLRGLFLENRELMALAGMPFAREISFTGRSSRPLSLDTVEEEMLAASRAMEEKLTRFTSGMNVPTRFELVRSTTEDVLRKALQEAGILAIGEPIVLAAPERFLELLADQPGIAGIVVAGSDARRSEGAIATVIEPGCDVAFLVDTAEHIAAESHQTVLLLIAGASPEEARKLETDARKAIDPGTRFQIERIDQLTPRALGTFTRRHGCGLAIAGTCGSIATSADEAARFACALECPMLILR